MIESIPDLGPQHWKIIGDGGMLIRWLGPNHGAGVAYLMVPTGEQVQLYYVDEAYFPHNLGSFTDPTEAIGAAKDHAGDTAPGE